MSVLEQLIQDCRINEELDVLLEIIEYIKEHEEEFPEVEDVYESIKHIISL